MSKEQIEEKHALSESVYMSGHGLDWKDSDDIAEQLYTEGYRKQREGEWIRYPHNSGIYCSLCKHKRRYRDINDAYCPNCGAKMKGCAE